MSSDAFSILGCEPRFDIDLRHVERTYRELAKALHPDRYAQCSASERRAALERASAVNEAWRILKDPVRRAEALFALASVPVGEGKEPQPNAEFLMAMLEERETLSQARRDGDAAGVAAIAASVRKRVRSLEDRLTAGFAHGPCESRVHALVGVLGELRFCRRILSEIDEFDDFEKKGSP